MAEFGRLDILVNAGTGVMAPIEEIAAEDVDRVLHVNVRAPYLACQATAAHLGEGGRIVTIGSCMAERVAFPGASLHATGKAALTGLTKALARELGPRGITVNLVHPGPIDTEMNPGGRAERRIPERPHGAGALREAGGGRRDGGASGRTRRPVRHRGLHRRGRRLHRLNRGGAERSGGRSAWVRSRGFGPFCHRPAPRSASRRSPSTRPATRPAATGERGATGGLPEPRGNRCRRRPGPG